MFSKVIGTVVIVIVGTFDYKLSLQSVPIPTKVVSSNPTHDEVYSVHHCVITLSGTLIINRMDGQIF